MTFTYSHARGPNIARFPHGYRKYLDRRYPDGIPFDIEDSVFYIEGNLWRHPDAGRIAYEEISPFLLSLGFSPSPSDDCFFIRGRPYPLTSATLTLIVDDITVSFDSDDAYDIMRDISNRYATKGAKPVDDICGITVEKTPDGYAMHQHDYIQQILSRYGYENCQPSATPLPPGFHAGPEDEHVGGNPTRPFE